MLKNTRQEYGVCTLQKYLAGYHGDWIITKGKSPNYYPEL